jgi:hypothetical protein
MAATEPSAMEPSSSGDVGWVELLPQQITGNCDFRLRWTEKGTQRVLLLTRNAHDDHVVIYCSCKTDGSAWRTSQHGYWRWHTDLGGALALQVGYNKRGMDALYIHIINMSPREGASPMLWEKLLQFEASLEVVTNCDCRATDAQPDADISPDWVMSAPPAANEF